MANKSVIHVVATECQPELEEKNNRWCDEVHNPMLMKFEGLKEITRYKVTCPPITGPVQEQGQISCTIAIFRLGDNSPFCSVKSTKPLMFYKMCSVLIGYLFKS